MAKLLKIWLMGVFLVLASPVVGQSVEMMSFDSLEQQMLQESDTLFVYNFWATWCKPCVEELPFFEKLDQTYREKKVRVVFVSLDAPSFHKTMLEPFIQKRGIQSKVILLNAPDYDSWLGKISEEWSGSIPATLLKMPSQNIHEFQEQSFTYETLTAWIDQVVSTIDSP